MYNRYIPQDDGTYRKNQMPEQRSVAGRPKPAPPTLQQEQEKPQQSAPQHDRMEKTPPCRQDQSAGSFLRQLLPKNMDTGDLMIILLLLLMAGDCAEDKNTALLTLALYLFM